MMAAFSFSNELAFGQKLAAFCGSSPVTAVEFLQDKNMTDLRGGVWKSYYIHQSAEPCLFKKFFLN